MMLSAFIAAWFIHLLAAASPGPAILMAAKVGVTDGFRVGVSLALGIGLGAVFWAVAAILGMAVLFQLVPSLFWGLKIIGGLALMWIAFQMWRHASDPILPQAGPITRMSIGRAFKLGVATQLANPKPAVFFGAVFVGTLPVDASPTWIFALLVAIFLNEFLCNIIVARLFSMAAIQNAYTRQKRWVDRTFGGVLALLGAKIALT